MLCTKSIFTLLCEMTRAPLALGGALLVLSSACGPLESSQDAPPDTVQQSRASDAMLNGNLISGEEHSATIFLIAFDPDADLRKPNRVSVCSGVRIRPDVILTAAHCFTRPYAQGMTRFIVTSAPAPLNPALAHETANRWSAVVDIALPESYKGGGIVTLAQADIAMGFLSTANFDDDMVEPAMYDGLDELHSGERLFSVAYGTDEQTWFANRGAGTKRTGHFFTQIVTPTHLTVKSADATACVGDSGAPLFSHDDPSIVVGILSQGHGNLLGFCKNPSMYTRVQAFEPWIKDELDARCKLGLRSEAVCAARP